METKQDKILDSPSKDSYIGSYYDPPDRIALTSNEVEVPVSPSISVKEQRQRPSPRVSLTSPDLDSKAVVEALKTLQEKIRRLELERKRAEINVDTFSLAAHNYEHGAAPTTIMKEASLSETDKSNQKELDSQLQSAETRCQVLEKQLDYMKMVEKAEKDKNALAEKQASLQRQRLLNSSDTQTQCEKLENLEKQCLKLNETQALAERKISVLEERLLKEEHERKLLQGKADELQKELNANLNLQLCPGGAEITPKKKKSTVAPRTPNSARRQGPPSSPSYTKGNRMPFVAGTSTSPSHSVHANLQSILHMMKHHQPQLCEQVQSMRRSGSGAKKSLRKALSGPTAAPHKPSPEQAAQSLSCLSDLLMALQDELGQMSFEHQELLSQIDVTNQRVHREDLERELEALVKKMEEKSAQITKLRKHQQTVQKLTQKPQDGYKASDIRAPLLSPVRAKRQGKGSRATPGNLQLLRETQQFNSRLKQNDLSWET